MPEFRKDIILDEWVIIATERAKRPENFKEEKVKIEKQSTGVCPFDKGNEAMTPPEILRVDKHGNIVGSDNEDWQIRVVPNKFPALIPYAKPLSHSYGVYMVMDGFGLHEVVIHSPEHITNIGELDRARIKMLINVYLERLRAIKRDTRIESVIVMLNQGKEAGASLEHSHSQIFALPLTPPVLQHELFRTRSYHKLHKRCAVCDLIKFEKEENKRIVHENRHFIILQPYAARNPFETWIVPKIHHPNFEQISGDQVESFASCLKMTVDFFYRELNDPPFNYYIHTGPTNSQQAYAHYHWNFEFIPKFSIKAGFEIATGIDINITTPEYTAEFMKASSIFKN